MDNMADYVEYENWDRTFGIRKNKSGEIYTIRSFGLADHELEYHGKGVPYACQARRQKLLLGNEEVAFGIARINNSYGNWTGDPFKDFQIDVLLGTKEEVKKIFRQCVQTCDECCGCGDW